MTANHDVNETDTALDEGFPWGATAVALTIAAITVLCWTALNQIIV